jgi:hypothetical protein
MKNKPQRYQSLETVATIALVLLCLGLFSHSRYFLCAAALLLAVGLFLPSLAGRLAQAWLALSRVLAAFNTRLLLTLVFYLVLTPIAVVRRLLKMDSLDLRRDAGRKTLWSDESDRPGCDFRRMW